MAEEDTGPLGGLANRLARFRKPAVLVRAAPQRLTRAEADRYVDSLGDAAPRVRALVEAVDAGLATVLSLSSLSAPLALDYLERLQRPLPALTPEMGVQIVTRAYMAHVAVEDDPAAFGAADVPVLGTLPPLRRGSPPQDLLTRVVKATRRGFELIRALDTPVWDGFVRTLVALVHGQAGDAPDGLVSIESVDGLARVGWVLRQVDLHYGLGPERAQPAGR
jgi:hypothetical protein